MWQIYSLTYMLLDDARLKIDRAKKHIEDIKARVSGLSDRYVGTIEKNPHVGNEVIKYVADDKPILTELALVIGDAIHNQKSALDYAWYRTIEKRLPSKISDHTSFPVRETQKQLEEALRGIHVDVQCPDLFDLMVTQIRPFEGGNDLLHDLHRLNILDKHKLLIPLAHYIGIHDIFMEDESGEVQPPSLAWGVTQNPPFYVELPLGWRVKNKGKITVSIVFDEEAKAPISDVIDTLNYFSLTVLNTIELLERAAYKALIGRATA